MVYTMGSHAHERKSLDKPPVTILGSGQSWNNYDKKHDEIFEIHVSVCGSVGFSHLQPGEGWA